MEKYITVNGVRLTVDGYVQWRDLSDNRFSTFYYAVWVIISIIGGMSTDVGSNLNYMFYAGMIYSLFGGFKSAVAYYRGQKLANKIKDIENMRMGRKTVK